MPSRIALSLVAALVVGPSSTANSLQAQTVPVSDVHTLDAVVSALYASISGGKGEARNWDRFRVLFAPDARLSSTWQRSDSSWALQSWSPDGYITTANAAMAQDGFFEREIARKTERFGNIAQLFSTYESRRNPMDSTPFQRGVNSIQLRHDGKQWAILSVLWQAESKLAPLPPEYDSPVPVVPRDRSTWSEFSKPGAEHARLNALVGTWNVHTVARTGVRTFTHTAEVSSLIGGRFLQIHMRLDSTAPANSSPVEARYLVAFDRRRSQYSLQVLDNWGTYPAHASGVERDGIIQLRGVDEDPNMRQMGFSKKFAFAIAPESASAFSIKTYFVDSRRPDEPLIESSHLAFSRVKPK